MKKDTTKRTTTFLHALLLTVLGGILWNCTSDDINDIRTTDANESSIAFSVNIPGGSTLQSGDAATRALTVEQENELNQIAVLLFDNNGYTYQPIYVSSNNITSSGQVKTFTVKVPEGTYDVVMLANANQSLSAVLSTISKGQSKAEVLKKLTLTNDGKWNTTAGSAGYKHIPMWGETSVTATKGATVTANFTLVRMLAKIDVSLSTTAKGKFNLSIVRLYNYNNQGQVVPDAGKWDSTNSEVTAPSIPSNTTKEVGPLVYQGNEITSGTSCLNEIYTFEAVAGSSANLATNTCLVVGGTFTGDSKVTYYRIDIANPKGTGASATTEYLPLLRNHNYKITVADVTGSGMGTPDAAFSSKPINMVANILNWSDAQITDIVFDGQYMLGVSAGEFTFSRASRDATDSDNTLYITTDSPTGWKLDKIVDASGNSAIWMRLCTSSGVAGTTSTVKLLLNGNTGDDAVDRTAFVHISAGRLTYIIKVVQLSTEISHLTITNAAGEPISILEFASAVDVQPAKQIFHANWHPTFPPLSYVNRAIGNGFVFNTGVGLDEFKESGFTDINQGTETYTIQPPAITSANLESDPFYERTSHLLFTVTDNAAIKNQSLILRQYAYNMVPVVDAEYEMDNPYSVKSFGVRSNTPFTVKVKSDPDRILTEYPNIQSVGTDAAVGRPNTSASGTRVQFKTIKSYAPKRDVVVTIQSPDKLFADKDVTLKCVPLATPTAEPESNSYILAPDGDPIAIPVLRANNSMLGTQLSAGETFTAELVWTDNSNKISADSNIKFIGTSGIGPEGYLVVEPGSAEGNAVVAIKKGNKILWSWHIWVTKETPTVKGTQKFMDRNLGAIGNTPGTVGAKGLLYQWGRKDPFPGSTTIDGTTEPSLYTKDGTTTIAKTAVTVNNNFANSVANPATFYHDGYSAPNDWYTNSESGQNNTLWDGGSSKTIYDPCPEGWRVPKNGAWNGLNAENAFPWDSKNLGRTADSHGGFYPTAGFRGNTNGKFYFVGSHCYYWSATVNRSNAYYLYFHSSYVDPRSYGYRATGRSVRCVQE